MNKTVVNASGDTHYKENKENFCASVQIFIYTQKINTARSFMNKIPNVPIFFLKTHNSVH